MNVNRKILSKRFQNDRLPRKYFTNKLMLKANKKLKDFNFLLRLWCKKGFELLYDDGTVRCVLRRDPSNKDQLVKCKYDEMLLDHLDACEKSYQSFFMPKCYVFKR